MESKPTIGIIFGGRSVEHEVSVLTGYQALEAIDRNKYNPIPIYLARDNVCYMGSQLETIDFFRQEHPPLDKLTRMYLCPDASRGKLILRPCDSSAFRKPKDVIIDCVIPATHGTFGEDGCLQGLLEMAGVPYAGSNVSSSAIGMDKLLTKAVLKESGLPFVPYTAVSRDNLKTAEEETIQIVETEIGYPAFIKPATLGSSVGVAWADNEDELRKALHFASRFCDRILVEKALIDATEINCSVLDGDPPTTSALEQPISETELLSFDEKYRGGGKGSKGSKGGKGMAAQKRVIPAPVTDEMRDKITKLAIQTFEASRSGGVVRIDFLISVNNEIYVNEINNIPGSFAYYLWEHKGGSFRELLDRMIERSIEIRRRTNKITYSFESNLLALKP